MKGRTLAVIVVVGLAVVGWAVFAVVRGGDRQQRPVKISTRTDTPRSPSEAKAEREPAREPAKAEPNEERPQRPPPEVPKPDISLEDAREQFDAYIAELDREIKKTEETGRDLSNEAWVEYYRRGHEAMDPLRRWLGQDPAGQKEVAERYELVREKLQKLEARPKLPP